ncbi:MAG TPA: hypothetical protein DCE55_29285 [Planctomycetaceae bacterium]|nr:hypothetical protein [Planctomycetaceae bacterium]|tara:strand:- start:14372 stop:14659 length:288 start_codon:yes stop_codon:yes gene_type:complete
MRGSGRAATNRRVCLEAIAAKPGMTAAEVAAYCGMQRHEPSRRLPELRSEGLVHNGTSRICEVTHNKSMTWIAGPAPQLDPEPERTGPAVQQSLF